MRKQQVSDKGSAQMRIGSLSCQWAAPSCWQSVVAQLQSLHATDPGPRPRKPHETVLLLVLISHEQDD